MPSTSLSWVEAVFPVIVVKSIVAVPALKIPPPGENAQRMRYAACTAVARLRFAHWCCRRLRQSRNRPFPEQPAGANNAWFVVMWSVAFD